MKTWWWFKSLSFHPITFIGIKENPNSALISQQAQANNSQLLINLNRFLILLFSVFCLAYMQHVFFCFFFFFHQKTLSLCYVPNVRTRMHAFQEKIFNPKVKIQCLLIFNADLITSIESSLVDFLIWSPAENKHYFKSVSKTSNCNRKKLHFYENKYVLSYLHDRIYYFNYIFAHITKCR